MRWLRPTVTAVAAFAVAAAAAAVAPAPAAARADRLQVDPTVPPPPTVRAAAWLVADLDTAAVLAGVNPHRRLAPASTLKILTALTLAPRLEPSALYVARPQDAAIDGSKVGLVPGSRYRVSDLMHGLLLGSGNDAANALASMARGVPQTTALMNQRARLLGATDTVAANPSGLDAAGQVSSPHDLALFGRAALDTPRLARIVVTTRYAFPARGTGFSSHRKRFEIQNHNRLLRNYPGATGVKNGFTEAARGSFVASAQHGERRYIVTLMRARPDAWHDAAALLDWAFRVGARAHAVDRLGAAAAAGAGSVGGLGNATPPPAGLERLPAAAAAAVAGSGGPRVPSSTGMLPAGGPAVLTVLLLVGVGLVGAGLVSVGLVSRRGAVPGWRRSGPGARRSRPASRRRR